MILFFPFPLVGCINILKIIKECGVEAKEEKLPCKKSRKRTQTAYDKGRGSHGVVPILNVYPENLLQMQFWISWTFLLI